MQHVKDLDNYEILTEHRLILATVRTFCSRLCRTKSECYQGNVRRVASCVCGDKTNLFLTLTKWPKHKQTLSTVSSQQKRENKCEAST